MKTVCVGSEWLHLWCHDLAGRILSVSVVAAASTDDKIRLLVDVGVVGVEILSVVVVKRSRLSIVLHHDLAEGADVLA